MCIVDLNISKKNEENQQKEYHDMINDVENIGMYF